MKTYYQISFDYTHRDYLDSYITHETTDFSTLEQAEEWIKRISDNEYFKLKELVKVTEEPIRTLQ